MLAPLTDFVEECGETKTTKKIKTKNKPCQWDLIHQQAFHNIKAPTAKKVVLAYPDFVKSFEIFMDASTMQSGAAFAQDNRAILLFSRKSSKTQQKTALSKLNSWRYWKY
jgi:hypothetical protein